MQMPHKRGDFRKYLVIIGLLAGHSTPSWILSGIPFLIFGIAFHIWAKGCLHQNREVTVTGPYRFVRHPFYLANIFLDTGIVIMSGWWLLQLVFPFWWLAVYIPTMRSEERFLTDLYGDAYREYRARVPGIIPWRYPLDPQSHGFSWKNRNLSRTEFPRTLRFLSYPLLFFIAYRLHSHGIGLLSSLAITDIFIIASMISLYFTSKAMRIHFRERRPILPVWLSWDFRLGILLAVIILGISIYHYEIEAEWAIWPPGFILVGISIWRALLREQVVAEALLAAGLFIFFELHWLAILFIPLYLAVFMDLRFRGVPIRFALPSKGVFIPWASTIAYHCLLSAGIILSLVKEFWIC